MPSELEHEMDAYRRRLLAELESSDHGKLFPLSLKLPARRGNRIPQFTSAGDQLVSFEELVARMSDRPIVVTGDPGSGKTTLLESFVRERLESGEPILFLRMGLWSKNRPLVEQLTGRCLSPSNAENLLKSTSSWVLFDALDEIQDGDVDAGFQEILDFCATFPRSRVVSTCRGAQLSPWAALKYDSAILQPISADDVESALTEALINSSDAGMSAIVRDELRELCRNPLMLSMTEELLLDGNGNVLEITSPSQIYELFIGLIDARERARHPRVSMLAREFVGGLNLKLLGFIAWRMMASMSVSVSEEHLAEWLQEVLSDENWSSWFGAAARPSPAELLAALIDRAPLKQIVSPTGGHPHITFMHLTFRDAFAGRHLLLTMRGRSAEQAITETLLDPQHRFWGAILAVVGIEEDVGATSRRTVDAAFENDRQDLLILAAQAVANRWDIDSDDIDDLSISMIEAFKNWKKPFDYELVRAIRGLIPRLGAEYPERLRDDLVYFTDKYASVVPRRLERTPLEELLTLLDEPRADVVIDVLYTLATHPFRSEKMKDRVGRLISQRLGSWDGQVAEQAVAALKDLGAPSCLSTLREVARSATSSHRTRAFAANGIAEMGGHGDLALLRDLLFDHAFRYRDSASWSLQTLFLRVRDIDDDPKLRDDLTATYLDALFREVDDSPARYAKGNILYSLGVLKAREHRDAIERFLIGQASGYVIEDGIYALGLIGDPASVPVLRACLQHADPAIRFKAAESLLSLQAMKKADVHLLRLDKYRIVRRIGDAMQKSIRHRIELSSDLRIVADVLGRGPARSDRIQVIYRIHPEERGPIQRLFDREMGTGGLQTHPRFLDHGSAHEVRFSREDTDTLQRLTGSE
ncbi:HEAT repeat domain-containing protein [Acrocarpospora sp. B8E8]|uniref:NACHT domain-containing protein n=1 Tax=Acrocarpospora sp. B8E8 TaxID=3153572 RepID=UPI00325F3EE2